MEFSLSRSKITLREANAAYRELRRNAKALMHRAETFLITAIVLYKILTNLFFLPAMRGIWSLTLRFSPVNYLTNNNAHQIFTAPSILGGIALIAVLAALWNLYEFSLVLHGLDFARRGEACKLRPLFRESFRHLQLYHPVGCARIHHGRHPGKADLSGAVQCHLPCRCAAHGLFCAGTAVVHLGTQKFRHRRQGELRLRQAAVFPGIGRAGPLELRGAAPHGSVVRAGHDADVRHRGGGGAGEHPRHAPALPRAAIGGAALLRPSAPSSGCSTSGPGAPVPLRRKSAPTASAAAPAGGCC